jgi:hypothetical protein
MRSRLIEGLLLVGLLAVSHYAAWRAGSWWGTPSLGRTVAGAALGRDASPAAVAVLAAGIDRGVDWIEQFPREALAHCATELHAMAERADGCARQLGRQVAAFDRLQARQRVSERTLADAARARSMGTQEVLDGPCAEWARQPVCPAVRVRIGTDRDRGGADADGPAAARLDRTPARAGDL